MIIIWDSSLPQNSTNGRLYLGWWFVVLRRRHLAVFGCSNHVKGWANAGTLPTIGVWCAPFISGASGGFLVVHHPEIQGNCLGGVLWGVPLDARLQSLRCDSWTFPQLTHCDQATSGREFTIRFLSLWLSFPNWQNRCFFQADITDVHVLFQVFKWNLSILSSASQKLWSDVRRRKKWRCDHSWSPTPRPCFWWTTLDLSVVPRVNYLPRYATIQDNYCVKPNNKPTIWGWFIVVGFTSLYN